MVDTTGCSDRARYGIYEEILLELLSDAESQESVRLFVRAASAELAQVVLRYGPEAAGDVMHEIGSTIVELSQLRLSGGEATSCHPTRPS